MRPRPLDRLAQALPFLVVLAVFLPTLGFGFAWDDGNLIVRNAALLRPDVWARAWTEDFWQVSRTPHDSGMYRPLVLCSYALERRLWGLDPRPYHAANLALALSCVAGVAALARRMGASATAAAVGATLFGVHPTQAATVANISSRPDLLATLGVLLGCRAALSAAAWPAAPVALLLALAAKESAVVGPALVTGCLLTAGERRPSRLATPWLALAAYVPVRLGLGLSPPVAEVSVSEGGTRLLAYLGRLLWPRPWVPYDPAPAYPPGVDALALLPVAALLLWVARPTRPPLVRLGALWALVALLPVSELVPVGARMDDLLLHLPLVGVGLALAGLADGHGERLGPRARGVLLLAAASLGVVTASRTQVWASNLELWTWTVARRPAHPEARLNLGAALRAEGRQAEGCAELGAAFELARAAEDGDVRVRSAHNLGNCAQDAGRTELAERWYREASAHAGGAFFPAEYGLSASLLRQGRAEEARQIALEMTGRWPAEPEGWIVLGAAQANLGRYEEAVASFDRCLQLDPTQAEAQALRDRAAERARAAEPRPAGPP